MLTVAQRFTTHDDYLAWADSRPAEERYEIVEGHPVMSPSPGYRHQACQLRLLVILDAACPPNFVTLAGPFDWVLWELPALQVREPDILVIPRPNDTSIRRIEEAPALAVEVLSPASVEVDLFTKRREYARAGLEHYWGVDPEAPRVLVHRREGDDMLLVADLTDEDRLIVTQPFAVDFALADLLR